METISLQCKAITSTSNLMSELIFDKSTRVGECCIAMVLALGLSGDDWHLCKTNWCGEEADVLQDELATLEQEKLKSGDILIVEEGKLPPKGYIRLAVFLYISNCKSALQQPQITSEGSPSSLGGGTTSSDRSISSSQENSLQSDIQVTGDKASSMDQEGLLHLLSPSQFYPPVPGELLQVGSVEISRESTVEDLKLHILTLPTFEKEVAIASGFLRLRELSNGRPGKIFKQSSYTLKITSPPPVPIEAPGVGVVVTPTTTTTASHRP